MDAAADPPTSLVSPRRNRVDPWGDLHAAAGRGLLTGNRGCLVDAGGTIVRHQQSSTWITCVTELRGRTQPLGAPGRWTPIFFLDEAVALAAGHRPCAYCRRDRYRAYAESVARAAPDGTTARPLAIELNRRLAAERYGPTTARPSTAQPSTARPFIRAPRRRLWTAAIATLPVGTVIVGIDSAPLLVGSDVLHTFGFEGWTSPAPRPAHGEVQVLTPPTSLAAMRQGYQPLLHPSAADAGPT